MFRTIHLMRRRPGMSPADFRDYYETRHRVLGEQAAGGHALSYARHYLEPMSPGDPAPIYDVMMQLCFPDRATFERCMGAVADNPAQREAFVEDELRLFDRAATATYLAETCSSVLLPLPPSDDMFRTVWFARRRSGMSPADCRAYYESKHRLLGEYIMNGFAYNYDRHHLAAIALGAPEPDYAFVMEMNFPSRARFEEMAAAIGADPVLSQLLAEDEARYTDRDSAVHYKAALCASEMPPLAMVAAA